MTSNLRNKILTVFAGALLLVGAGSCVKTQEQIFDKSSSARVQEMVLETRKALTGAENGWIMYYYPHTEAIYGGYLFAMEFGEDGFVTVYGDNKPAPARSLYTTKMEDGAILTVDTGNAVFQEFATPTSSQYQAFKGDFEFIIQKVTADEILLRGRRTANFIKMVPLKGSTAAEYIEKVRSVRASLDGLFEGQLGDDNARVIVSSGTRHADITVGEETVSTPFFYTPEGIKFFTPGLEEYIGKVEVSGTAVSGFDWHADSFSLTPPAEDGVEASLVLKGWHAYDEYLGKWDLTYNQDAARWPFAKTVEVELVADKEGETYLMKGVNSNYDLRVNYVITSGSLRFLPQIVAPWGKQSVAVACFTLNSIAAGSDDDSSYINVSGYNVKAYGNSGWQTIENEEATVASGKLSLDFSAYNNGALGNSEFVAMGLLIVENDGSWNSYGNGSALNGYHLFDNTRYIAPFWSTMVKK